MKKTHSKSLGRSKLDRSPRAPADNKIRTLYSRRKPGYYIQPAAARRQNAKRWRAECATGMHASHELSMLVCWSAPDEGSYLRVRLEVCGCTQHMYAMHVCMSVVSYVRETLPPSSLTSRPPESSTRFAPCSITRPSSPL